MRLAGNELSALIQASCESFCSFNCRFIFHHEGLFLSMLLYSRRIRTFSQRTLAREVIDNFACGFLTYKRGQLFHAGDCDLLY